jgi:hypothetical protein
MTIAICLYPPMSAVPDLCGGMNFPALFTAYDGKRLWFHGRYHLVVRDGVRRCVAPRERSTEGIRTIDSMRELYSEALKDLLPAELVRCESDDKQSADLSAAATLGSSVLAATAREVVLATAADWCSAWLSYL